MTYLREGVMLLILGLVSWTGLGIVDMGKQVEGLTKDVSYMQKDIAVLKTKVDDALFDRYKRADAETDIKEIVALIKEKSKDR